MIFPKATTEFNVASYNIHRCVGMDGKLNPERIVRVIKELNADVIGLQEIDSQFYRRDKHSQIDYLVEGTGLNVVIGPTLQRHDGHYGNALLTSHPILDVRRIDLSIRGKEPRGAIDADIDMGGTPVRVIVAHLGLGIRERRQQIRRLQEIFCAETNRFEVMLGDFNEWNPKGAPLCWIHDHFGKPPSKRTFPSFLPFLSLDRIWVRPLNSLIHMCTHVSPLSRMASDHLPVTAKIDLAAEVDEVDPLCECL
jgi:endonuclease/exonuclease/phosphatase family metal-dependent hydrolase